MATKNPEIKKYNIPLLTADQIDARVGRAGKTQNGGWAILLLYKDARVDMKILDELFGQMGWQRSHEIIGGNMYCTIAVLNPDTGEWIKKSDVGVESNQDKEKGQASDAFKRAAVNWGIGRELYTAPTIFINLQEGEFEVEGNKVKVKPAVGLRVKEIDYNDAREITRVIIVDANGRQRYPKTPLNNQQNDTQGQGKTGAGVNPSAEVQNAPTAKIEACPHCQKPITTPEIDFSMKKYGRALCKACQKQYEALVAAKAREKEERGQ